LIQKINASIRFCYNKKKSVIEDKYKAQEHSLEPQKAHITGELAIWHKIISCFVWSLGLRPWSVSETKFWVLMMLKKIIYLPTCKCFLVWILPSCKMSPGWFLGGIMHYFAVHVTSAQPHCLLHKLYIFWVDNVWKLNEVAKCKAGLLTS